MKSGYSHKNTIVVSTGFFFVLVSKERRVHETFKTMHVICIEHTFVIQNIPIFVSKFIKPKSNWFKNFVYDLFETELIIL
jgi:hypothetical protein